MGVAAQPVWEFWSMELGPGLGVVAGQSGWQAWRAGPSDVGSRGRAFATRPLCGLLVLAAVLAGRVGTLG
ncbi:hypothetical protein ACFV97_06915 [Streptomyces sp. NPDC059913]|uniref:hypothetical protein n=1 Tax=unclassified Streptomyces TaxID=2593676 RepID=UPI00364A7A97